MPTPRATVFFCEGDFGGFDRVLDAGLGAIVEDEVGSDERVIVKDSADAESWVVLGDATGVVGDVVMATDWQKSLLLISPA